MQGLLFGKKLYLYFNGKFCLPQSFTGAIENSPRHLYEEIKSLFLSLSIFCVSSLSLALSKVPPSLCLSLFLFLYLCIYLPYLVFLPLSKPLRQSVYLISFTIFFSLFPFPVIYLSLSLSGIVDGVLHKREENYENPKL